MYDQEERLREKYDLMGEDDFALESLLANVLSYGAPQEKADAGKDSSPQRSVRFAAPVTEEDLIKIIGSVYQRQHEKVQPGQQPLRKIGLQIGRLKAMSFLPSYTRDH